MLFILAVVERIMEELIEVLSTVYENYFNDIRELERFFNRLIGKHKHSVHLPEKGDKVTQTLKQVRADLKGSKENLSLGWKADTSTQSEQDDDEQLENTTHRKIEELEKTKSMIIKLSEKLNQVQNQLKQSKERIRFLEEESETEKLTLAKTRDSLEKAKIQIKTEEQSQTDGEVTQLQEKIKCLENQYRLERSAHQKTSEDLEQAQVRVREQDEKNAQIQVQLAESRKTAKCLESHLLNEKAAHEQTRELLERDNRQNKARDDRNKLKDKRDRPESEAPAHKKKSPGWPMTLKKRAAEKEMSAESHLSDSSKELKSVVEELRDQLQHTKSERSSLKDSYEKEKAAHQSTKEALEQANYQIKVLTEKSEGRWVKNTSATKLEARVQQLQDKEQRLKEQVFQLQSSLKRFREDLLACASVMDEPKSLREAVMALKMRHLNDDAEADVDNIFEENYKLEINDLRTKIENCAALLDASLKSNTRLEEKLSGVDRVYAKRERDYVKLINKYVIKAHALQTKASAPKCNKPLQQRLRSWFKQNVLRNPPDASDDPEKPPDLYPDDWRLPNIPDLRWKTRVRSKR